MRHFRRGKDALVIVNCVLENSSPTGTVQNPEEVLQALCMVPASGSVLKMKTMAYTSTKSSVLLTYRVNVETLTMYLCT